MVWIIFVQVLGVHSVVAQTFSLNRSLYFVCKTPPTTVPRVQLFPSLGSKVEYFQTPVSLVTHRLCSRTLNWIFRKRECLKVRMRRHFVVWKHFIKLEIKLWHGMCCVGQDSLHKRYMLTTDYSWCIILKRRRRLLLYSVVMNSPPPPYFYNNKYKIVVLIF